MTMQKLEQAHEPGKNLVNKLIDFFGGVKEFNTAMAILGPSIINVLQAQVENENGMLGMFQLGSGALLLSGNYMFFKNGDPSMHSRMGMVTGGMKTLLGVSLFAIGFAGAMGIDEGAGLTTSLAYLGYCSQTLASVIDLFNSAVYGKQVLDDTRKLSAKQN
ncbi:hypothetical protein E3983_04445 [Legionella israelensis]|uniref:Uncharacterized protein n=2 Tax=Legionella israelensis TaxID=454 RepID=A0A0W0WBM9_9GAMM|nr:hypothetical protein [Legionella israelensis]KTD29761.1 hypothetical protein Lisr_0821 [Legionella israelensis]QBR83671.1 hypothetical protein E3983_04445 [Legionella israelensis]QBS08886.1 hypothetical protein E4T55_02835 [Legionella israelensis]SCY03102.1 hypothetical protein SAMN02746069_01052 [Legionella israelensis DSM 19235]STX58572.1 Uncharacterised protein [Legionella israelensis]